MRKLVPGLMRGAVGLLLGTLIICWACVDDRTPEPPVDALRASDGSRWMIVKAANGRAGRESIWWSVDWRDLPCRSSECEHVYNGNRQQPIYDRFRANIMQMHEGEVRRVWTPVGDGYAAYDVHLERVYETDVAGDPVIVNN